MTGKIHTAPLAVAGIAYPAAVRDNAIGEPLSFVLSFGVIFLVLLLDSLFRKLGG
jgi:hypothetical protein